MNLCHPPPLFVAPDGVPTRPLLFPPLFPLPGRGAEFHPELPGLRSTGAAVGLPKLRGCELLAAPLCPKLRGCELLAGPLCPKLRHPELPGAELPGLAMADRCASVAGVEFIPWRPGAPKRLLPSFAGERGFPPFA